MKVRSRTTRLGPSAFILLSLLAGSLLSPPAVSQGFAQEIPRDRYLRFVPLLQPRLTSQTEASRELHLYGDRADPSYRDREPVDGIDDRRGERLLALAARFSPLFVRNTTHRPIAFEGFIRRGPAFPLHIDTWELHRGGWTRVGSRTIDVSPRRGPEDDRSLLRLFREFDPRRPGSQAFPAAVHPPEGRRFQVLFFDFPGSGPADWRREYRSLISGQTPREYAALKRLYAHPFAHAARTPDGERRYELVMQYFAFYPSNDGGNDHEGDWQPLNVVITTRANAERGVATLSRAEVEGILDGSGAEGSQDLVMARVEYFFHFNVWALDFLEPNVYRSRETWRREVEGRSEERLGEAWIWARTREMAYTGPDETEVSTHPLVYIGGDNKGMDQLLAAPGGTNRDGHASYPFPGLYKDIGPAGAAEAITAPLDLHWRTLGSGRRPPARVERYDDPSLLRILPDWERLIDLVERKPDARRDWFWHVLPVRFGYPAVRSPFAGIVSHAETGNLAPPGPAYNNKWNRIGSLTTDGQYQPHKFSGTFPLGWQDAFMNSWGFLNLTLPTLTILPPFDFIWRLPLWPLRVPFTSRHPTFYPQERIPFRFVGAGGGVSVSFLPENFVLLFTDPVLFDQIQPALDATDPSGTIENVDATAGLGPLAMVQFHVGRKFVTENMVRRVEGDLGFDVRRPDGELVPVEGDLELWEYSGSLRYNLKTGAILPFVKAGYGLSWFRVAGATLGGEPLDPEETDWKRRPSLFPPDNLLPNTWHAGAGVEAVPIRNYGPLPRGLDVSVKASWSVYVHGLGLTRREVLAEQEDFTLARSHLDLRLMLSY